MISSSKDKVVKSSELRGDETRESYRKRLGYCRLRLVPGKNYLLLTVTQFQPIPKVTKRCMAIVHPLRVITLFHIWTGVSDQSTERWLQQHNGELTEINVLC